MNRSSLLHKRLLQIIPQVLINITEGNLTVPYYQTQIFDKNFHSDFTYYFNRLAHYMKAETNTLIYSFILIDKLTESSGLSLTKDNISNIFFVSLVLSLKLLEDVIWNEEICCFVGGIPKDLYSLMERKFLELLDYQVYVSYEQFTLYYRTFSK